MKKYKLLLSLLCHGTKLYVNSLFLYYCLEVNFNQIPIHVISGILKFVHFYTSFPLLHYSGKSSRNNRESYCAARLHIFTSGIQNPAGKVNSLCSVYMCIHMLLGNVEHWKSPYPGFHQKTVPQVGLGALGQERKLHSRNCLH